MFYKTLRVNVPHKCPSDRSKYLVRVRENKLGWTVILSLVFLTLVFFLSSASLVVVYGRSLAEPEYGIGLFEVYKCGAIMVTLCIRRLVQTYSISIHLSSLYKLHINAGTSILNVVRIRIVMFRSGVLLYK